MDRQRIRTGDIVIIHRPEDRNEQPTWIEDMDIFDNTFAEVISVYHYSNRNYTVLRFNDNGVGNTFNSIEDFDFNEKWVEFVRHAGDEDFEVGDEVIIHKPANARRLGGKPSWQPEMDKYDGLKTTIVEIDPQPDWNLARMEHCRHYSFNLKWLEHAEDVDVVLEDNDLTDFLGGFVHG